MKLPEQQILQTKDKGTAHRIAAKYRGNGTHLLVFLHGFGCAKECFDQAFQEESLDAYSILTFDLLGHGRSDHPSDFSYSMEAQAAVAGAVIGQYRYDELSVIAHSMSGAIGLICAPQLKRLAHFISVEGNLVAEDVGIVSQRTAIQSEADFLQKGFGDFLRTLENSGKSDLTAWAKWYKAADKAALYKSAKSLLQWSNSGTLLKMFNALPSNMYIYGDEERKDYLLERFSSTVTTQCIPDSGHFMMLDQPEAFYAAVASFVGQTST